VSTGAVVSTIVTIWLQVELLLQGSVAFQVLVMFREQSVPLVTVLRTIVITLVPLQASRALGSSKLQTEPHWTVLFVAQVNTGAVVSAIVTVWLQMELLVQRSVACQVRVISSEQPVPLVVVFRTETVTFVPLQASRALGWSKVQAEPHSTVLLVAQVNTGAAVSTTVTVWLQVELLVQGSVACQVRVMSSEQPVPLVTVFRMETVTLVPLQASNALGSSKVQAEPHSTVLLVAQVMFGGVVSATVTTWLQVALLELQSVACQVCVTTIEQPVPLVIVLRTVVVTFVPQQESVALGASNVQAEPHSTVLFVAQVMSGGEVSSTVTVALPVRSPGRAVQLASLKIVTV